MRLLMLQLLSINCPSGVITITVSGCTPSPMPPSSPFVLFSPRGPHSSLKSLWSNWSSLAGYSLYPRWSSVTWFSFGSRLECAFCVIVLILVAVHVGIGRQWRFPVTGTNTYERIVWTQPLITVALVFWQYLAGYYSNSLVNQLNLRQEN